MTPKGYTTRQQVENYLLITIDSSFYTQVGDWITAMEQHVEKITGRVFIADTTATARSFDGNGEGTLLIDDLVQLTGLKIGTDDTQTYVDGTDYYLYPANKLPKRKIVLEGASFTPGNQNIIVTGKWGYSVDVPADVLFATTVLVAGIINYSNNSDGEIQSETIGSYSVTYKDERQWQDFDRAKSILSSYRKLPL